MYVFFYDDKGTPYGVFTLIDGVQEHLFYLYNAQGDVIAIIDDYAERVVNYEYGAWGELLSVTGSKADTVGALNPFRYRGYCYDTETGLYYLNSRYYDPVTQRFVNGDGYASTGQGILGYNMFAYCLNDPIMYYDNSGSCANAWSAGYQGPCPGFGKPGCMDSWSIFSDSPSVEDYNGFLLPTQKLSPAPEPFWPAPGYNTITSKFGKRYVKGVEGASTNHKGIDIGAPKGADVIASISGTITIHPYSSSAGNYITISNGTYETRYLHLSKITWDIETMGTEVFAGQKIGEVGNTGLRGMGYHLHFDVKKNGEYMNPEDFLR